MLSGKKYPQNVRALTMLVEEILVSVFGNSTLKACLTFKKYSMILHLKAG